MKKVYISPATEVTPVSAEYLILAGSPNETDWGTGPGDGDKKDGLKTDDNPVGDNDPGLPSAKGYTAWQGDFWDDWY